MPTERSTAHVSRPRLLKCTENTIKAREAKPQSKYQHLEVPWSPGSCTTRAQSTSRKPSNYILHQPVLLFSPRQSQAQHRPSEPFLLVSVMPTCPSLATRQRPRVLTILPWSAISTHTFSAQLSRRLSTAPPHSRESLPTPGQASDSNDTHLSPGPHRGFPAGCGAWQGGSGFAVPNTLCT